MRSPCWHGAPTPDRREEAPLAKDRLDESVSLENAVVYFLYGSLGTGRTARTTAHLP